MIEVLIEDNQIIDIVENINYPNQRIFIFNIDDYVVSVPFIESEKEIFLKAIFKSRKLNKKFNKG
ncbi:MAG: hypothetical protein ACK4M7_07870 [Burkholderiales bacterium]